MSNPAEPPASSADPVVPPVLVPASAPVRVRGALVRTAKAATLTRMRRPAPPTVADVTADGARGAEDSSSSIQDKLLGRLLTPIHDGASTVVVLLVAAAVTAVAAVLRLVELGRPSRLVFDETYYVKQAYSLLRLGYEGRWAEDPNLHFAIGNFSDLGTTADYVVHPSIGKWMIAAGMAVDPASPVAWRVSAALTGIVSVFLLVLIARRLFGHIVFGAVAGLLLAVDGIHIVMSRISILDIFLSFWILLGFGALLLDRESYRRTLARAAAAELTTHGTYRDVWGPRTGIRWWLIVAGLCLGMATGVKWSGAYVIAVFGLVAVVWAITARRIIGVRMWVGGGLIKDGIPAFLMLVPTALLTYLATWIPWFISPNSYLRQWAVTGQGDEAVRTWLPDGLNSLVEYHLRMWEFHTNLTSEHTYMSNPLGWLIQFRPTSFAWQKISGEGAELMCKADECASAILAVGNPIVWWGGAVALFFLLWGAIVRRDWRAWAILAGYFGGYLPWLAYMHRTIFTFYTVAFVPFVALALTYALAVAIGPQTIALRERKFGLWATVGVVAAAVVMAAYFWPIWSAKWVPHWFWYAHIFLPTWI